MRTRTAGILAATILVLLSPMVRAQAQAGKAPYPAMAPVERYLIPSRDAEIALARTAAPPSISATAEVMVLGRGGYTTAVAGKNGFVCIVERSWSGGDDSQFWNPNNRSPICFNKPAAQTYLPITLMRTRLALAGKSKQDIFHAIETALDTRALPPLAPGALAYMLSPRQYLADDVRRWHPHLMLFAPRTAPQGWGANLPGSPLIASDDPEDRMTIFMVTFPRWSDGSADTQ